MGAVRTLADPQPAGHNLSRSGSAAQRDTSEPTLVRFEAVDLSSSPLLPADVGSVGAAGYQHAGRRHHGAAGRRHRRVGHIGCIPLRVPNAERRRRHRRSRLEAVTAPVGANWAMAGIMFRDSLSAGARHAALLRTDGKLKFRQRSTDGGYTVSDGPSAGSTVTPRWLRLTRRGNSSPRITRLTVCSGPGSTCPRRSRWRRRPTQGSGCSETKARASARHGSATSASAHPDSRTALRIQTGNRGLPSCLHGHSASSGASCRPDGPIGCPRCVHSTKRSHLAAPCRSFANVRSCSARPTPCSGSGTTCHRYANSPPPRARARRAGTRAPSSRRTPWPLPPDTRNRVG